MTLFLIESTARCAHHDFSQCGKCSEQAPTHGRYELAPIPWTPSEALVGRARPVLPAQTGPCGERRSATRMRPSSPDAHAEPPIAGLRRPRRGRSLSLRPRSDHRPAHRLNDPGSGGRASIDPGAVQPSRIALRSIVPSWHHLFSPLGTAQRRSRREDRRSDPWST